MKGCAVVIHRTFFYVRTGVLCVFCGPEPVNAANAGVAAGLTTNKC